MFGDLNSAMHRGSHGQSGVIQLAVMDIFGQISALESSSGRVFRIRVSMLELYNERINDLLAEEASRFAYITMLQQDEVIVNIA